MSSPDHTDYSAWKVVITGVRFGNNKAFHYRIKSCNAFVVGTDACNCDTIATGMDVNI